MMTPAMVHYGIAPLIRNKRQLVLDTAFAAPPERFVKGHPTPPELPTEVRINKPGSS